MVTFLGDVAITSAALKSTYKPKSAYVFNCEYVIGDPCELPVVPNKINLASPLCNFASIFGSSPVAVGLANNHIFDFGEIGYEKTIDALHKQAIGTAGETPCFLNDSVCLLSYMALDSNSDNNKRFLFDYKTAEADMERVRQTHAHAAIVISIHWGIENHPQQNREQVEIGHWLIDHGADLIIGHHPHCIQPVEIYKGKCIFYSLGNCLFPNINQPSHYTQAGRPTRTYRFKWQHWNRKSLAVMFDEKSKTVQVDELYQKQNCLLCRKKAVPLTRYTKLKRGANVLYALRKYYLFFVSNVFVDGKLFDLGAVKAERNK